jgi:hypothetical protein
MGFFSHGYGAGILMGLKFVDINIWRERGLGLYIYYDCQYCDNDTLLTRLKACISLRVIREGESTA